MDQRPGLKSTDLGALLAAAMVAIGAILPFWVADFGNGFVVNLDFLDTDGGFFLIVAAAAAVALTALRARIAAIVALAAGALLVLWRMTDIGTIFGLLTYGVGVYLVFAGTIGGIILLAIGHANSTTPSSSGPEWAAFPTFGERLQPITPPGMANRRQPISPMPEVDYYGNPIAPQPPATSQEPATPQPPPNPHATPDPRTPGAPRLPIDHG